MTFDEWIVFIFDHPVTDPAWHWEIDMGWPEIDNRTMTAYLTRLFENGPAVLAAYTDAQINQGLGLVVSGTCSDCMRALCDKTVPLEERVCCIHAIETLYRDLFAVRCNDFQPDNRDAENPLNGIGYIWWDIAPIHTCGSEITSACLDVLEQMLEMDSNTIRKGALLGLLGWGDDRAGDIVDDFLDRHPQLDPSVEAYAKMVGWL
jgi:hypothetical protein